MGIHKYRTEELFYIHRVLVEAYGEKVICEILDASTVTRMDAESLYTRAMHKRTGIKNKAPSGIASKTKGELCGLIARQFFTYARARKAGVLNKLFLESSLANDPKAAFDEEFTRLVSKELDQRNEKYINEVENSIFVPLAEKLHDNRKDLANDQSLYKYMWALIRSQNTSLGHLAIALYEDEHVNNPSRSEEIGLAYRDHAQYSETIIRLETSVRNLEIALQEEKGRDASKVDVIKIRMREEVARKDEQIGVLSKEKADLRKCKEDLERTVVKLEKSLASAQQRVQNLCEDASVAKVEEYRDRVLQAESESKEALELLELAESEKRATNDSNAELKIKVQNLMAILDSYENEGDAETQDLAEIFSGALEEEGYDYELLEAAFVGGFQSMSYVGKNARPFQNIQRNTFGKLKDKGKIHGLRDLIDKLVSEGVCLEGKGKGFYSVNNKFEDVTSRNLRDYCTQLRDHFRSLSA
jgi:hypothetical protein